MLFSSTISIIVPVFDAEHNVTVEVTAEIKKSRFSEFFLVDGKVLRSLDGSRVLPNVKANREFVGTTHIGKVVETNPSKVSKIVSKSTTKVVQTTKGVSKITVDAAKDAAGMVKTGVVKPVKVVQGRKGRKAEAKVEELQNSAMAMTNSAG